jgi:hypothetical protein
MNIILQSGKLTMNRPIAELIQLIYASLFTAVSAVKSGGALVNNASQQSASDSESGSSEVYYQPPATRKLRSDQQIMQDEEMKSTAPSSQDERLQLNALLLLQTISKVIC